MVILMGDPSLVKDYVETIGQVDLKWRPKMSDP